MGLTEKPTALHRWMVAGPEMARMINEFEFTTKKERIHIGIIMSKKGMHSCHLRKAFKHSLLQ